MWSAFGTQFFYHAPEVTQEQPRSGRSQKTQAQKE